jgi:ATPase components of ABC transporters with duplicated ATPase domains
MLDKIVRLDAPDKPPELRNVVFETQINSGNDVLHIENLNKSFNEKKLFENIAFNINRGEKTALIGENGRGKTTLFKIIMNETPKDDGICELGKNVIIGYYDQEQSNLNNDKNCNRRSMG